MDIQKRLLLSLSFYLLIRSEYGDDSWSPSPQIKPSVGKIWPKPKFERRFENNFIDPNNFDFVIVGETCPTLDEALLRYTKIIKETVKSPIYANQNILFGSKIINKIAVNLTTLCEHIPHLEMDEAYEILGAESMSANSIWGILRALETYSQSITPTINGMLKVPNIRVIDSPRFPHRGLLLDTARHYMNMETIFTILDGMAYNKLNVFHWHIVDDQSFPYQSVKFPELSEKGAYTPLMIYSQKNISNIIEYARMRGIRVVAEFDVPGHSRSWGNSHPEILTNCESGHLGPMNPIGEETYNFLEHFFSEVVNAFPDKYIHLGGDEVGVRCWTSNEVIDKHFENSDQIYRFFQYKFMERIRKLFANNSMAPILWQEAMLGNKMPNATIIQVWTHDWQSLMYEFTPFGYRILISGCWYLDRISSGGDWIDFYKCEPYNFHGTAKEKKLIIGGEACMWSEVVNNNNVIQRIFPRVSAAAERLWSSEDTTNLDDAMERLEEHTCRMILRGVHAQPPNGPGIC